jgi:hypothetical protein
MSNSRIKLYEEEPRRERPERGVQPIGEILEELLAQYQAKFPDIQITLVETAATPV